MIDQKEPSSTVSNSNRYHGIGEFKVIAINPDKEERAKLGYKRTEDFTGYKLDNGSVRVEFTLRRDVEGEEAQNLPLAFWLNNREITSEKTPGVKKHIWIDKHGVSSIYLTKEEMMSKDYTSSFTDKKGNVITTTSFDKESARVALDGEPALMAFIKSWLRVRGDNECILNNIQNIFNEDYSELTGIKSNYTVLVPLGIESKEGTNNDGQPVTYYNYRFWNKLEAFQGGFGKSIASTYGDFSKNLTKIADALQKDSYTLDIKKHDFGVYPYVWKKYNPNAVEVAAPVSSDLPF